MAEENEEEVDKVVFTDEQIAELKQAFALFDMDGSGEVSTDELGTVLETLGQKVTQEELVQIIAEVDSLIYKLKILFTLTIIFDIYIKCSLTHILY